jgi:hypothetical protein
MRRTFFLVLTAAVVGFAAGAQAQVLCVGPAGAGECAPSPGFATNRISADATFCAPGVTDVVLNEPIFVADGATLTINPGCVVRGQPRQTAVVAGMVAGTPGALIVTRSGRINAIGTDAAPVIFTTAAMDNVAPAREADDVDANPGFLDPYPGPAGPQVGTFLDDDPANLPLSPLNPSGVQNTQLWGGVVLLGNAPTNNSNFQGIGYGLVTVEGMLVPGFPAADVSYGGVDPHDSSGRMQYVSIRHAGDQIGSDNELNCLSGGALGDGTQLSFIECYVNFDDGLELFGGTVDADHIAVSFMGDDMFDLDEGYTGVGQFWFGIQGNFNQDSGALYGTVSGDKCAEWDGDNYLFDTMSAGLHNLSTRHQWPSIPAPGSVIEQTPWPLSNPTVFNMTCMGASPDADGFANPAVSPLSAAALGDNRGIDMRNGFAGKLINAFVVNTAGGSGIGGPGLDVRNGDDPATKLTELGGPAAYLADTTMSITNPGTRQALQFVVTSAFDDVAPIPGRDTAGGPNAETRVLANGEAIAGGLGATSTLSVVNDRAGPAPGSISLCAGLTQEDSFIIPTGSPSDPGVLDPTDSVLPVNGPVDPDPAFGACGFGGVPPYLPGTDPLATYKGAFEPGADNWTTGWTALEAGGVVTPF